MPLGDIMSRKNSVKHRNIDKKIDRMGSNFSENWTHVLFVVLGVFIFLGIFVLLTVYITNKNSTTTETDTDDSTSTTIQYEEILAGSSFSMNKEEYLVLYYDMSDESLATELASKVMDYQNSAQLSLYTVDLSSAFNQKYVTENDSNLSPTKASELKVKNPTLIRFSNGTVAEYIEGEESISNYLSE